MLKHPCPSVPITLFPKFNVKQTRKVHQPCPTNYTSYTKLYWPVMTPSGDKSTRAPVEMHIVWSFTTVLLPFNNHDDLEEGDESCCLD